MPEIPMCCFEIWDYEKKCFVKCPRTAVKFFVSVCGNRLYPHCEVCANDVPRDKYVKMSDENIALYMAQNGLEK